MVAVAYPLPRSPHTDAVVLDLILRGRDAKYPDAVGAISRDQIVIDRVLARSINHDAREILQGARSGRIEPDEIATDQIVSGTTGQLYACVEIPRNEVAQPRQKPVAADLVLARPVVDRHTEFVPQFVGARHICPDTDGVDAIVTAPLAYHGDKIGRASCRECGALRERSRHYTTRQT